MVMNAPVGDCLVNKEKLDYDWVYSKL